jgi:hypothetical protein
MQPLMERNGSLLHLLRTLRESYHIAQGLVFNGSAVFWAGTNGLYPAWASTYDSELGSINYQMGSGLSISLTRARLVLFHHASCLPLCRLRLLILLDQYSASNPISAFATLPPNLCSSASTGHSIRVSSAPISPLQASGPPFLSYLASSPGAAARLFRCLMTQSSLA